MEEEIVVTVSPGEETPPPAETPPAVVVVAETPAAPVESAVTVFSLEQLAERISVLEIENGQLKDRIQFLSDWQDSQSQRISELETEEVIEEETEPVEIVAEVIPPEAATPEVTEEPKARKRRFI